MKDLMIFIGFLISIIGFGLAGIYTDDVNSSLTTVIDGIILFIAGLWLSSMIMLTNIIYELKEEIRKVKDTSVNRVCDVLSDVLSNHLHGDEIDEVIAEFEEKLIKR